MSAIKSLAKTWRVKDWNRAGSVLPELPDVPNRAVLVSLNVTDGSADRTGAVVFVENALHPTTGATKTGNASAGRNARMRNVEMTAAANHAGLARDHRMNVSRDFVSANRIVKAKNAEPMAVEDYADYAKPESHAMPDFAA